MHSFVNFPHSYIKLFLKAGKTQNWSKAFVADKSMFAK